MCHLLLCAPRNAHSVALCTKRRDLTHLPPYSGAACAFTCQHSVQLLLKVASREHVRALSLLIHLEYRLPQRVFLPRRYGHLQDSAESL